MMRSWEARGDTAVVDEPLYAAYLRSTGLDHPGASEIMAHDETDVAAVSARLVSPGADAPAIVYQKHMAHHLLPGMERDWVDRLRNGLLIREPREMLTSLLKVLPNADLAATGLPFQADLFARSDSSLPVVDSRDVLENPPGMLAAMCRAFGVPYTDRMLSWAPGPRATDGVWAKYWYASVEASTGFAPYAPKNAEVPRRKLALLRECETIYDALAGHKLAADTERGPRASEE